MACCCISAAKVQELWAQMPLGPSTDKEAVADQIRKAPRDWKAVYDFLTKNDLNALAPGRHDITAKGFFLNVQDYETKSESQYEVHRKFIDIQIVSKGREYIYVAPLENAGEVTKPYVEANDIEFFADAKDPKAYVCDAENYIVLFPGDVHEPCMTIDKPCQVRKIIVKLPLL